MEAYFDTLDPEAKKRYKEKLGILGLDSCPYLIPEDAWQDKVTSWPPVDWPSIYGYLIDTPGTFTRESLKSYKSLEAYSFFESGWVDTCWMHTTSSGLVVLKSKVIPSQRITEEPHQPWVGLKKDGTVITAHCTCMAG